MFNNIKAPGIKLIVKKEEKTKEEKEHKKDSLFEIKANKTENYGILFGDESKEKESESTGVKYLFDTDIKPKSMKVFDNSILDEAPKPANKTAAIASGLFNEEAPKKANSLFDESQEKKENKDKKGVTPLIDESTSKTNKNLFDDEPRKPARKKAKKVIKKLE